MGPPQSLVLLLYTAPFLILHCQCRGGELWSAIFPQFLQISAIFRNFPQFPQFSRNFPQFSAILGGYRNFYPWEYLILQFSEGLQNHNMWFKIHNFWFEHPFFNQNLWKLTINVWFFFLLDFGLVWNCNFFGAPFPCSLSGNRIFFLSPDHNFP